MTDHLSPDHLRALADRLEQSTAATQNADSQFLDQLQRKMSGQWASADSNLSEQIDAKTTGSWVGVPLDPGAAMTAGDDRPAHAALADLDRVVAERATAARQAEQQLQVATDEARDLGEKRVEALSRQDENGAKRINGQREEKLTARRDDLVERVEAGRRALQRARAQRAGFVTDNLASLLDELRPDADQAADNIADAGRELLATSRHWHSLESSVSDLMRHAPASARSRLPSLDVWDTVGRDIRRALDRGNPPTPMPDTTPATTVTFDFGHEDALA